MTPKTRFLIGIVVILLVATFVRLHLLESQSFWNDEGNSARLSERSISAILEGTASDVHPPLYYLILRGWRELAGETEFGLRSFSVMAGILTVAATIALARRQNGLRFAGVLLAAGFLAAFSPALVYYSQETRMYALLALITALSSWALLVWLDRHRNCLPARRWAVVYVILLTAGLYTHYFFPAIIASQALIVVAAIWLITRSTGAGQAEGQTPGKEVGWRVFWRWVGMVAIAGALYLAWVPIFLRQMGGRAGEVPSVVSFFAQSTRWLVLGATTRVDEYTWAIGAALLLILAGTIAGGRRAFAPIVLAVVPLALMAFVGATDPAFFKFMLVIIPFLCVLAGLAWRWTGWMKAVPVILTVAVLFGSGRSLNNMYSDPGFARADYRGIAQRISEEADPDAAVILNAPNQWEAFTYYHRDGAPVYPLPRGQPDPAILEPELVQIAANHDRLYVLYWGDSQRDPDHVIERWLDAHTYKATEEWIGDVRFVVYAMPRELDVEPQPSDARFVAENGDVIRLHEFAVFPSESRPGDIVQTQLQWSADMKPSGAYKVFLHLVDDEGHLVAQRDSEPEGGSRPTTTWEPVERIVDNHGLWLPDDLETGLYTLRLGLYDVSDPAARLTLTGEDTAGDSLEIATIRIQ